MTRVTLTFADAVTHAEVADWLRDFDRDLDRPPYIGSEIHPGRAPSIRELDQEARRRHGCRVVSNELLEDFQSGQAREGKYYSLLVNTHLALYGIVEDYSGIRHVRLRKRLQKIRRGILAGLGR